MARQINRSEAWERVHEIFAQVNFNAFDYDTIKESLLDYMKLYYPETFQDFIESSEFIAILELFAYVGELLAYRIDLNAHEVYILSAQRKESILRLAKLISYKSTRNIPARGLVKMTSIKTTETVIDSAGRNLAGRQVFWNDNNNPDWKEQFILVINRVLEQNFGSVAPSERIQIDDVLFELYSFNNNPLNSNKRSVFSFSAATGEGNNVSMEIVPVSLTNTGPVERRPELNLKFSLLYASDGLGDSSDTTGFLLYIKQGTLSYRTKSFDGVTPNQFYDLDVVNINETDIWLNNVNAESGEILINDPYKDLLPHLVSEDLRYGEWIEVDLANAQNIIFNTNKNRHKYEVESLNEDQVRLVFGDGEFSDIPSGTFHIWFRSSDNSNLYIERTAVSNKSAAFTYTDANGSIQTLSFTFSLINAIQNASASESIEHIRRVAPSVYYTQDRMVNGRDYNVFMLQDPSILRLRSINRTFAGDSKYIAWHDPRENYEDVKLFGDDMALYWNEHNPINGGVKIISSALNSETILDDYIEPLLSSTDFFAIIAPKYQELGLNPANIRRLFNGTENEYSFGVDFRGKTNERAAVLAALDDAISTSSFVDIYYSPYYDEWTVEPHPCDDSGSLIPVSCISGVNPSFWMIRVNAEFEGGSLLSGWTVHWATRRLIAYSLDTRFWNSNNTTRILNFDTLNSRGDNIVILQANVNANGTGLLDSNRTFPVIAQELLEGNVPNSGLPDIHRLSVLPEDQNGDGIPDNLLLDQIFDSTFEYEWKVCVDPSSSPIPSSNCSLPQGWNLNGPYIDIDHAFGKKYNYSDLKGKDLDVEVYVNNVRYTFEDGDLEASTFDIGSLSTDGTTVVANTITFTGRNVGSPLNRPQPEEGDIIRFIFKDYVYFTRDSVIEDWIPVEISDSIRTLYVAETTEILDKQRYIRYPGRYKLNFAWFHYVPRMNLVDPAASNIIDMYIVTVGYYNALRRWLSGRTDVEPSLPTPFELRNSYANLIDNKMISDTLVLHPGKFKILFGSRADPQLQCKFKVIRPVETSLTDNEVKVRIVNNIRQFFDIDSWEFGEQCSATEIFASIHHELGPEIDSVVLVPTYANTQFGDMFQIQAREDELFIPDINTGNIEIVQSFTPENLRQNRE